MKIIVIGSVSFSLRILKKIYLNNFEIVGVCTKKFSKYNSDHVDLGEYCLVKNINFFHTQDINNEESLNWIKAKNPDLILCVGWSQIIKKTLLNIPLKGIIGYHPSNLPRNRGRHPIIWALILGLETTASTFFLMDEGTDSGAIISQNEIKIMYEDNASTLYEKICQTAEKQIIDILLDKNFDPKSFKKQNDEMANIWRKREPKDGIIDWRMNSRDIYNLVRALTKPYIGASFIYKNKEIKVWSVKEIPHKEKNIEPGKVLEKNDAGQLLIKAGSNAIQINHIIYHIDIRKGDYL